MNTEGSDPQDDIFNPDPLPPICYRACVNNDPQEGIFNPDLQYHNDPQEGIFNPDLLYHLFVTGLL